MRLLGLIALALITFVLGQVALIFVEDRAGKQSWQAGAVEIGTMVVIAAEVLATYAS
jgi:hypothetical protein